MKKSINAWAFPKGTSIANAVEAARQAGFEAIEPTLDLKGELAITTDESACRKLGDQIRQGGLEVASLASGLNWQASFTSSDQAERTRAMEWTIAGLDRARWLETDVLLVVPGLVSHFREPAQLITGYADALHWAYVALTELAPEAERRGVVIAVENVWNQFLLSPVEVRDLIDRVNSPWVNVYFDVGNVLKYGFPQDWIEILASRIARVHLKDFKIERATLEGFCPLGDGDVNWPAVMASLRRCAYDGPLTYEGPGDLADISRRIDRILAHA